MPNNNRKLVAIGTTDNDDLIIQQIDQIERLIQPDDFWNVEQLQSTLNQAFNYCLAIVSSNQSNDMQVLAYCLYNHIFEISEILRIGTHPDYRRQGLATMLINAMKDRVVAKDNKPDNAQKILLEVRADNHSAISLYESMHFTTIDRRKNYYRTTDKNNVNAKFMGVNVSKDALIMECRLT